MAVLAKFQSSQINKLTSELNKAKSKNTDPYNLFVRDKNESESPLKALKHKNKQHLANITIGQKDENVKNRR